MLKERHANLVVTKVAEKLEAIRKQQNAKALENIRKDPRLVKLKALHNLEKKAAEKRQKLYDEIVKDVDGIAWLGNGGKINVRSVNTYPSKSELSIIKMDIIHQILRGKVTDIDSLIEKIVAERSKKQ